MRPVQALIAVILISGCLPLMAQDPADSDPQPGDPPNRVARLNWISGDVSLQPAGLEDWMTAVVNRPLTTGDHLFTGKDARAEVHVGSNVIRLDAHTNFGFLNLDDSILQVSVTEGSLEIQLRTLADSDTVEVATPNGAVALQRRGDYRIDTDPGTDATMLTVRSGQAELFYGPNSIKIHDRQTAYFLTDQFPDIRSSNLSDDFDSFVLAREGDTGIAPGNRLVYDTVPDLAIDQITGAEDLDHYGTWESTPNYGEVWVPPVDAGWTPYSDGNWAYLDPWGWTWIDNAPWGFTVFHYGRWAMLGGRWVWVSRPRSSRQVYAPALVSFIGGGAADNVSWFPLAPGETWTPPWRAASQNSVRWGMSPNRRIVRTMSQADFLAGNRPNPVLGLAPDGQVLGSSPLLAPVRGSVLTGASRVPPRLTQRALIAHTQPPAQVLPFAVRANLIAQNHGRPPAPRQIAELRREMPAATRTAPVRYSVPLPAKPKVAPGAAAPKAAAPK